MITISKLTLRQRQVLIHLLQGVGEKEVSRRLSVSVHTVHAHVRQIYLVFGVHSLTELMAKYLDEHADPSTVMEDCREHAA